MDPSIDLVATQIPTLLIQPLVENAVKHGLAPRASGGTVCLRARVENYKILLTVEDDGVGFGNSPVTSQGAGSGLANCRSRMKLMYGEQGGCEVRAREREVRS